jgi:outer membrane protein assembly complex protein YaeT
MRPIPVLVVVCALLALAPLRAQDALADFMGRTVTDIRFQIEGREATSPALLALVGVSAGKPLAAADVRSSLERLDRTGRYDDISVIAAPTAGGVSVTFRLTPRHPIVALEIRGDPGIPASDLRNQIEQRYGGVPGLSSRASVEQTARQLLGDAGYLDASVSSDLILQHDPEGSRLVLAVEAGPLARIGNVEVRGRSTLTAEQIRHRVGAEPGAPYRRRDLEAALTGIEDDLRAAGYYEAETTMQVAAGANGLVDLTITANAGPRVELRIEPKDALPGNTDDLIPLQRERSADLDLLEDSKARIEAALHRDGYADARAAFTRVLAEDNSVLVVTFTISRGPRYFVDHVEFEGATSLPADTLRALVAMHTGDVFDQERYVAGVARVVDAYLRAGYFQVHAEPARQSIPTRTTDRVGWLVLQPTITEGPQARIGPITFTFTGTHAVPETDLRRVMTSRTGQPYVQAQVAADRDALRNAYHDRGFLSAAVDIVPVIPEPNADVHEVPLNLTISEGPQTIVGGITIVGNQQVSARAIEDELRIQPGQPLGAAAVREMQQRLTDMGVFRRVSLTTVNRGNEAELIVSVVELPANSVGVGFGLEAYRRTLFVDGTLVDRLEVAPRGFFEIGRRNLGGRNRSLNLFSRASLGREDVRNPQTDTSTYGFAEYRVTGTYRERRAFRTDTDLLLGLTSEQGVRTDFNFIRRSANAETLRRLSRTISAAGRYELTFTRLFDVRLQNEDDPLELAKLFPQVRLSILGGGIAWDRRDNQLATRRGVFVTADGEVAARRIGSEVGYLKTFWQASAFEPLDTDARTVLAMRAEVGLARGFERSVVVTEPDGSTTTQVVRDLPVSQRFFAGGSTTVRGFQQDRLGVPEIINVNGLSLGGNGVVILNAELRRTVSKLFGHELAVVGFLDGGNVFARALDIDLGRIRRTAGFGARWNSPLGPVRLDLGFKLNRETSTERAWEYHLSIGEAF